MEKIINWLTSEQGRLVLDYALVLVPIVVSCIAIAISVRTAKKQNKIAMFQIRYTAIFQMQTILNFVSGLEGTDDPKIILRLFDSLWGTNGTKADYEDNLIQYRSKLEKIKSDVLQFEFAFNYKCKTDPSDIVYALHLVVMAAISEKDIAVNVSSLKALCQSFYEIDYKQLTKKTRI